jgi:hypothetical protein
MVPLFRPVSSRAISKALSLRFLAVSLLGEEVNLVQKAIHRSVRSGELQIAFVGAFQRRNIISVAAELGSLQIEEQDVARIQSLFVDEMVDGLTRQGALTGAADTDQGHHAGEIEVLNHLIEDLPAHSLL